MIFESFKKHFVPKEEIRFLDGGEIRGPEYYLVSKEADVMRGKLRVQWASQKPTPAFRQGFEPFRFPHGDHKFCISTSTIPVPRLQDSEWQSLEASGSGASVSKRESSFGLRAVKFRCA